MSSPVSGQVGLQSTIWSNNSKSLILLALFPLIIFAIIWAMVFVFSAYPSQGASVNFSNALNGANQFILKYGIFILAGVVIWFIIAWMSHQSIINKDTGAKPLDRRDNPEIYNLLENLCISRGIKMPKLFIIDSSVLNAYASGISEKSFAITLTSGLISKLEKDELEAVLAHELSHIMNRDVRLLIISIIFVGIIGFIAESMIRSVFYSSSNKENGKSQMVKILFVIAIAIIGYLITILVRFALSRRREYLADAGAVELTKNSDALVRALKKISTNSDLDVDDDVKQMMIINKKAFLGLFSTHPPVEKRIALLSNF